MERALFSLAKLHTSTKATHSARQEKKPPSFSADYDRKRHKERAQLHTAGKAVDPMNAGGDMFVLLSGRL